MMSTDINEPIILGSKSNDISFYLSLIAPLLLISLGLYSFLENGDVFLSEGGENGNFFIFLFLSGEHFY